LEITGTLHYPPSSCCAGVALNGPRPQCFNWPRIFGTLANSQFSHLSADWLPIDSLFFLAFCCRPSVQWLFLVSWHTRTTGFVAVWGVASCCGTFSSNRGQCSPYRTMTFTLGLGVKVRRPGSRLNTDTEMCKASLPSVRGVLSASHTH
jgi:hypothetical protein